MTGARSFRQSKWPAAWVLVLGMIIAPATASGDGRVALVVGNGAYAHVGHLPNARNDASDVAQALRRLGFDVTAAADANHVDFNRALRDFSRQSAGADVSLVFYAGHGMEMDGVNFLLPVDARMERDTEVRYETVTLDDVLASTMGAGLRMVILDACRNNPLAQSMQRTTATRSVSQGSFGELNESLLGDETLVAYAAAAGTTADDGVGRNSPYTTALLEFLEAPLEVSMLFRRVRARVLELTGQRQRPHEYQSLLAEHYLGRTTASPSMNTSLGGADVTRLEQENLFWQTVAASAAPEDYRAYLAQFPNGAYAPLARNRLLSLAGPGEGPGAGDPSTSSVGDPGSSADVRDPVDLSTILNRGLSASRKDDNDWTDLHYAAAANLSGVVRSLLAGGSRVDAELKRDGRPLTAEVRRALRRAGHDFDTWTRDGETPLHVAAFVGARDAALELLAGGANQDAGTKFDWRPLHYAAWAGAVDVVELLLTYGADIDARTDEVNRPGRTALQLAVEAGSSRVAEVLRTNGGSR